MEGVRPLQDVRCSHIIKPLVRNHVKLFLRPKFVFFSQAFACLIESMQIDKTHNFNIMREVIFRSQCGFSNKTAARKREA